MFETDGTVSLRTVQLLFEHELCIYGPEVTASHFTPTNKRRIITKTIMYDCNGCWLYRLLLKYCNKVSSTPEDSFPKASFYREEPARPSMNLFGFQRFLVFDFQFNAPRPVERPHAGYAYWSKIHHSAKELKPGRLIRGTFRLLWFLSAADGKENAKANSADWERGGEENEVKAG